MLILIIMVKAITTISIMVEAIDQITTLEEATIDTMVEAIMDTAIKAGATEIMVEVNTATLFLI